MKIGLDIGGSHIAIGIVNNENKLLQKYEKDIKISESKNPKECLLDNIVLLIEDVISKIDKNKVNLIGVACPGNIQKGKIIKAENLNLVNVDIVKELENKFNVKVLLKNDAKCAAIAEKTVGAIKNFKDVCFLTLGTGIGGAIFIDGKMVLPKSEIGHMVIDINGEKCSCGRNGCFETLCSMKKFKKDIIEKLQLSSDTTGIEIRQFLKNKSTYDLAKDTIDVFIHNLSIGITNLVRIFKPEVICIGGSFTHYEDILLDKLKKQLEDEVGLFNSNDLPQILMATLKNDAGIIGATIA